MPEGHVGFVEELPGVKTQGSTLKKSVPTGRHGHRMSFEGRHKHILGTRVRPVIAALTQRYSDVRAFVAGNVRGAA